MVGGVADQTGSEKKIKKKKRLTTLKMLESFIFEPPWSTNVTALAEFRL
jgi:hypothetical protein